MSFDALLKVAVVVWLVVGIGLSCYLIYFPVFMKKNIARILGLLQRIAEGLEKRS